MDSFGSVFTKSPARTFLLLDQAGPTIYTATGTPYQPTVEQAASQPI